MTNALARVVPQSALLLTGDRQRTARDILDAWRAGKSAHTMRSYEYDLTAFARFLSAGLAITPPLKVDAALDRLFHQDSASAHGVVLSWRGSMLEANLAPATVNRSLATLRSISKLARMLGLMTWYCEVPGVKAERRRDVRGPSVEDVRRMIEATAGDSEPETRDAAIVTTLFCLGLRVSELCGLNLEETDLARGTTWITGKARREKEQIPLPVPVIAALRRYLEHRGTAVRGPLFLSRSQRPGRDGRRLGTRSVLRIVRDLGERVGLHVWCHGLRHTAITEAIIGGQRAGLGLDQITAFSRHRSLTTMMLYRDEHDRAGVQRQLVDVVAASLVA
jgi:integrase/recombinase XerC